jgi:hypothetical protein
LAATDGDHSVDGFDTSLEGGVNVLAEDDAGRDALDGPGFGAGGEVAFVVDRLTKGVDDATEEGIANWDFDDTTGRTDGIAFFDLGVRAQEDHTDGFFFEIEGHAHDGAALAAMSVLKLDKLGRHDIAEAMYAGDAVANFNDGTDVYCAYWLAEALDLFLDY